MMNQEARAKALFFEAADRYDAGDYAGSERQLREVLTLVPERSSVLGNLAGAVLRQGRLDEALALATRAVALDDENISAVSIAVTAQLELGKLEAALATFDRLLKLTPEDAEAWATRANVFAHLSRWSEALASFDQALSLRPDYAEALCNRGNVLKELKRLHEALASYERALNLRPDYVEALSNRGLVLEVLKRPDEALASYDRALAVRPDFPEALSNRGNVLNDLNRLEEALASYDRALELRSDYAEALSNRSITLKKLGRLEEALASCDRAVTLRPDYAEALFKRGNILRDLNRQGEALASYDRVLALQPDHPHAFSGAAACAIRLCDWERRAGFAEELEERVADNRSIISPLALIAYGGGPALQLRCAQKSIRHDVPSLPRPIWHGETWRHDKLRLAYLSADFRQHAVSYLLAELIERHDRLRFEVFGVSFGGDDGSEMRRRLIGAFDRFHDVRRDSDEEIARLLHDLQIDIAIDLNGFTQNSRTGILAHRPAPIQVNYLGYPGTMGSAFIDYIVADKTVTPFEQQPFFVEKIVHLPDCYLVNPSKREVADRPPTAQAMGLPADGFVFCSFNNMWKITPAMFDVWMRLLHQVEGSVLWLKRDNATAERNLREEARRRGIDPIRLVFAGPLPLDEHLARYRLADLFLDTLPYNAHTTGSDALWAGLPVLTCMGEAFAGRAAASLLHAVGIPELITSNLEDYEALALRLARDPVLLSDIRTRLERNRSTCPLFDNARFTRHMEAAYTTMWETWQRGDAPQSFSVEPT